MEEIKDIAKKPLTGMTQEEAANTLFGIDIMQDNVDESIERLSEIAPDARNIFEKNIVCGDFLHPQGIWFLED